MCLQEVRQMVQSRYGFQVDSFDTAADALAEAVEAAEAYASIHASGLSFSKPEVVQTLCVALDFPFQAATVGFKPTSFGAGLDLSVLGWDTEPFLNARGSDKSTIALRSHRLRHLQAMAECMSLSGRYITERTPGFSWKDAWAIQNCRTPLRRNIQSVW
jgi:hypothetical protein